MVEEKKKSIFTKKENKIIIIIKKKKKSFYNQILKIKNKFSHYNGEYEHFRFRI
jgi:hypothetical protein